MYQTEHAKRFRVFRNGDRGFLGKEVTVSRQNARNWDTFLQNVTDVVKAPEAVRDLCTPTGGTRVTCYDDLVDRECYVAVGRAKFRDIGYMTLDVANTPRDNRNSWSGEDLKSLNQHRFKAHSRIYDAASECDVMIIFVYANGDDINAPRRVTLPRRLLTDVDDVMEEINKHVTLVSGAARLLYTVNGDLIHQPHTQLENRAHYVAVGSEFGGFKQVKYGNPQKPAFVTYASNRNGADPSQRLRTKNESSSKNTSASSLPPDALRYHKASSRSQIDLHNKQRAQRNGLRHTYGGTGAFHAKPANASNRYQHVDYDNDEGGVFRSKRTTRYTANEIQDSWETKTDLPVDHRRAEEVQEEANVCGRNGVPRMRRGGAAPIGKKSSTTNAHEDYMLKPLNMRQSKVARSFEAQRSSRDMGGDEREAVTERRRGQRVVPPPQQRSKARIIEDEGDWTDDRGRAGNRNGVVQRKNERNKPTPRSESQNYTPRDGAMDSYRDQQPGRGSRRGNGTDRSDQGSLTRTQQRGTGRWNKNSVDDEDEEEEELHTTTKINMNKNNRNNKNRKKRRITTKQQEKEHVN